MNRRAHGPFVAPSESFWARLFVTPVMDIFRGKVTGSMSARRLIARAQLPNQVSDAIWAAVQTSQLLRTNRVRFTSELVDFAGSSLVEGMPPDRVTAEITERVGYLAIVDRSLPICRLHALPAQRKLPAEVLQLLRRISERLQGGRSNRREAALAIYNRMVAEL